MILPVTIRRANRRSIGAHLLPSGAYSASDRLQFMLSQHRTAYQGSSDLAPRLTVGRSDILFDNVQSVTKPRTGFR